MMTRAHIITGSFGAGKTTAIRGLMAQKPGDELWVVILNEFTDAGVDALSVAQSANGSFDVRLVAGGCLCCVGELEFGKQIRDILRTLKPVRLIIEPSGAGHAADIVDELRVYESQGVLQLDSIVCLVDPRDAIRIAAFRETTEWSQIQSADVLLLSKADLATEHERAAFAEIAELQFPVKGFVGSYGAGRLPAAALQPYVRRTRFSLLPTSHAMTPPLAIPFEIAGLPANECRWEQLGLHGVSWILPNELTFSRTVLEPRIEWCLQAYGGLMRRMKGVFRTGPGPSWMVQSAGRGLSIEDSAYRRDSRLEIVLLAPPTDALLEAWRDLLQHAALPVRAAAAGTTR